MTKSILCVLFLTSFSFFAYGQNDSSKMSVVKNAFFVEYWGNAGSPNGLLLPSFSINYDRILREGAFSKISIRIGSNIPFARSGGRITKQEFIIPALINGLLGRKRCFLELGIGVELVSNNFYNDPFLAFTSVLGFRYQNYKNGLIARFGITPTIGRFAASPPYAGYFLGISLGYCFK